MFVDAEIAAEIAAREFRKIEPVMQDRPQHAVGEAVVVFLVVVFGKVGDDILDVFVFDGLAFSVRQLRRPCRSSRTRRRRCFCSAGRNATSSPPARLDVDGERERGWIRRLIVPIPILPAP